MDEDTTASATIQKLINAVDAAQRVMFRLIEWVILYFLVGVFALGLVNFTQNGTLLFGPYLRITLSVVVGVTLTIFVIYPLAIAIFCRETPSASSIAFARQCSPPSLPAPQLRPFPSPSRPWKASVSTKRSPASPSPWGQPLIWTASASIAPSLSSLR